MTVVELVERYISLKSGVKQSTLANYKTVINNLKKTEFAYRHVDQVKLSDAKMFLPLITPHVCRHTFCSNMAREGINPKTLQYLTGHSDIAVTMNVYTHLGLDDAREELARLKEAKNELKFKKII